MRGASFVVGLALMGLAFALGKAWPDPHTTAIEKTNGKPRCVAMLARAS